jgi:RNA polymerase sigma factor (sigma-70 family)
MTIPKIPFPELVAQRVKELRGYALRLAGGNHAQADDLQQETILRALAAQEKFVVGTNITAWLLTIMKNLAFSGFRKKREVEDPEGVHEASLVAPSYSGEESGSTENLRKALALLPEEQREVVLLAADGVSTLGIADRLGVEEGTVKSRLNRGRVRLAELLGEGKKAETSKTGTVRNEHGHLQIRNNEFRPGIRSFDVSQFNPVVPATDPGPVPELLWLRISDLRIDERYQRSVLGKGMTNIRYIATNFQWSKFTAVCVARWEGIDYVVDGQHRTYGAALRGLERVPCLVMRAPPEVAADAFAAINGRTTAIHALNVWGARVAAGDPEAVALDKACRAEGVLIKRYPVPVLKMRPGQTVALGALQRGMKDLGEPGLRLALRLLMTAHPEERGVLTGSLLRVALRLVARLLEDHPADVMRAAQGISFTSALLEAPSDLPGPRRVEHVVASLYRRIRERLP